jgi:prevent-host-death family protein
LTISTSSPWPFFWTDRTDSYNVFHIKPLQLQEAKQQFSAVAERAAGGQPQIVTKHGKPFVVVVSVADWQEARPKKRTLLEMLRSCPVDANELDLRRSKELPRKIAL